MEQITLYTTHCPKCQVLEKKLMQAQITFDVCEDIDYMTERGWKQAPVLTVGEKIFTFAEAVKWVNEVKK